MYITSLHTRSRCSAVPSLARRCSLDCICTLMRNRGGGYYTNTHPRTPLLGVPVLQQSQRRRIHFRPTYVPAGRVSLGSSLVVLVLLVFFVGLVIVALVVRADVRDSRLRNGTGGDAGRVSVSSQHVQDGDGGDSPVSDAPHEPPPEEVQALEEQNGYEDLVPHPPGHPYAVLGVPPLRCLTRKGSGINDKVRRPARVAATYGMRSKWNQTE